MKYIAAYMLAKLGKENPTIEDLQRIIESVGIEFDHKKAEEIINKLTGKNINEVIEDGKSKLSVVSNNQIVHSDQQQQASNENENSNKNHEEEEEVTYDVEKILNHRTKYKKLQFYLKWEGWSEDDNSWEDFENLNCPEKIVEYRNKVISDTGVDVLSFFSFVQIVP